MSEPTIGLTLAQIHQLRSLADRLRESLGNDITNQDVWFGHHVANYLSSLALDAAAEKLPVRPAKGGISTRAAPAVRKLSLSTLQDALGRKLTTQDLLDLASPVDSGIAEAIGKDIERLAP